MGIKGGRVKGVVGSRVWVGVKGWWGSREWVGVKGW